MRNRPSRCSNRHRRRYRRDSRLRERHRRWSTCLRCTCRRRSTSKPPQHSGRSQDRSTRRYRTRRRRSRSGHPHHRLRRDAPHCTRCPSCTHCPRSTADPGRRTPRIDCPSTWCRPRCTCCCRSTLGPRHRTRRTCSFPRCTSRPSPCTCCRRSRLGSDHRTFRSYPSRRCRRPSDRSCPKRYRGFRRSSHPRRTRCHRNRSDRFRRKPCRGRDPDRCTPHHRRTNVRRSTSGRRRRKAGRGRRHTRRPCMPFPSRSRFVRERRTAACCSRPSVRPSLRPSRCRTKRKTSSTFRCRSSKRRRSPTSSR